MIGSGLPAIGRRGLLVGLGALTVAGAATACGSDAATTSPDPSPGSTGAAPDALRRDVATAERMLIASYDAAISAHPQLEGPLAVIRGQHADHLAAMGGEGADPVAGPAPSAAATPGAGTAAEAVADLRRAEQAAARERRASCVAADDPELARLLALIAASEQSHAAALRRVGIA